MPAIMLRRVVGPALRRTPLTRSIVRGSMNAMLRLALLPFGRNRPDGTVRESEDLVARTDGLNRAAEHYYTAFDETEYLLGKPFTDELSLPRHLFSMGVLLNGLRLRRSDVVVEFGAGSCWVSHFLNRFGCRTISIDVSQTALNLGQQLFRRDPATDWSLGPEFLTYDGRRIPLADGSCDKIIVFDAFHHIPNQREILCELRRILKPHGIVAMSEPGLGHADTQASRNEVEKYGVLENELVIEDLAALAIACGFTAANLIIASPDAAWEIPARDLGAFIQGKGFSRFWEHHSDALLAGHYVLLYKGDPRPTTRQPKAIGADIRPVRRSSGVVATVGSQAQICLELVNTRETRWLAGRRDDGGWTRLGGHLYRTGGERQIVDFDWLRAELPKDVDQNERITMVVETPRLTSPGTFEIVFDLVIEGVTWFADRGSKTASVTLDVRP